MVASMSANQLVLVDVTVLRQLIRDEVRGAIDEANEPPAWLTSEQAGELLGLHSKSAARLARQGDIRAVKVGRSYRFERRDVESFLRGEGASNGGHHTQ
jgi:excisionase family DNA binding protein